MRGYRRGSTPAEHRAGEPLQVAHMRALEHLPDALADGVRARVGRAAQAEDDVLVGVAGDVAAGHHPGAVGRAAELERVEPAISVRSRSKNAAPRSPSRRIAPPPGGGGGCAGARSRHTCTMMASPWPPPEQIAAQP